MKQLPLLFTPIQVAKIMQISRSQVYVLLRSGALPSVSIGRCRRIPADRLTNYIQSLMKGV